MTRVGSQRHSKNIYIYIYIITAFSQRSLVCYFFRSYAQRGSSSARRKLLAKYPVASARVPVADTRSAATAQHPHRNLISLPLSTHPVSTALSSLPSPSNQRYSHTIVPTH